MEYTDYLLTPREKFARAYAQYIAWKLPSSLNRTQMNGMIDDIASRSGLYKIQHQWDWDDFDDIGKEFDNLFAEMGWLENE